MAAKVGGDQILLQFRKGEYMDVQGASGSHPDEIQSPVSRVLAGARHEVLAWIGVIGTAITLVGSLSPLIMISNWASFIVTSWKTYMMAFWSWGFSWLSIEIDAFARDALSFCFFFAAIILSVMVKRAVTGDHRRFEYKRDFWLYIANRWGIMVIFCLFMWPVVGYGVFTTIGFTPNPTYFPPPGRGSILGPIALFLGIGLIFVLRTMVDAAPKLWRIIGLVAVLLTLDQLSLVLPEIQFYIGEAEANVGFHRILAVRPNIGRGSVWRR
jgi:hypothetical protein